MVSDDFYPGGVGHYWRYRVYEVWDNYQRRFRYSGTPVYEHYTPISHGCNLFVDTGEAQLNGDARFSDSFVANGIEACNQFPDCVSRFEQLLQVESTVWSKEVAYACYGVTVTP